MSQRRTNGFTLIEMLTVLVIVAVLIGLTIPAVTNLMKSGGVNAASREVANTLSLARQYAVTHRTATCVVFPYSGTTTAGTNLAPLYQSYAVLAVGSAPTYVYVSKWEHLPLGTVFMDANHASVGNPPSVDNLNLGVPASFPFPYTNSPPATLAFIQFNPWGTASQSGSFTIAEGFVNNGAPTPTSKTTTNTLANMALVSVDSLVGRIQVTRP